MVPIPVSARALWICAALDAQDHFIGQYPYFRYTPCASSGYEKKFAKAWNDESSLWGEKSFSPPARHLSQVEQWLLSCFPWAGANYIQLVLCRIFSLNHLICEVIQGVHSFHCFTRHFSVGHELLLSEEEDCSEEETGKQEEPISRESGISHCSISADCVGHFCNVLRSIWQCSCQKYTQQHLMKSKVAFCRFLSTDSMHHRTVVMQQLKQREADGGLWDLPRCKQERLQYSDPGVLWTTQTSFSAFVSKALYQATGLEMMHCCF